MTIEQGILLVAGLGPLIYGVAAILTWRLLSRTEPKKVDVQERGRDNATLQFLQAEVTRCHDETTTLRQEIIEERRKREQSDRDLAWIRQWLQGRENPPDRPGPRRWGDGPPEDSPAG